MTTPEIKSRLRAACVVHRGRMHIRQFAAAQAVGLSSSHIHCWTRTRGVPAVRVSGGARKGVDPGYAVLYRASKFWRAWLTRRRFWSQQEVDFLLAHAGRRPRTWIASNLDRSPASITHKLQAMGLSYYTADGLYTTGDIAQMAERTIQAVRLWTKLGLPVEVPARGTGHYALMDLDEVTAWLRTKPGIVRGLSERAKRRLGLTVEHEVAA